MNMNKRNKKNYRAQMLERRLRIITAFVGYAIERNEDEYSEEHRTEVLFFLMEQLEEWGYIYV